jgi:hypothetical protein
MTTREIVRGQLRELRMNRQPGGFAMLVIALFGFLAGEGFGDRNDLECDSCATGAPLERCAAVSLYNSREAHSALSNGVSVPLHDPWLVEAGWSGAYHAPLY